MLPSIKSYVAVPPLRKFRLTVFILIISGITASGQNPTPETDVLRINTSLIKAGVSVYDKNGAFVNGLKKDDFIVKADGKIVDSFFFDRTFVRALPGREEYKQPRRIAQGNFRNFAYSFRPDDCLCNRRPSSFAAEYNPGQKNGSAFYRAPNAAER